MNASSAEAAGSAKPVPVPETEDLPYWEGLQRGELVLQRCDSCGALTQRAMLLCANCGCEERTWTAVSGRGTVYSFAVANQTWVRGFQGETLYVIVVVSVAEWPSLLITTNLVNSSDPDAIGLGADVRAVFEPRGDQVMLQYELVGGSHV